MNFVEETAGYTMTQLKFQLNNKLGQKLSQKVDRNETKFEFIKRLKNRLNESNLNLKKN